jgi:hypothetical protein
MKRIILVMAAIATLLAGGQLLNGGQSPQPATVTSCQEPLKPHLRTSLYMDRINLNSSSRWISDKEWRGFVDEVLQRHFPAGGTIYANSGWWRRPDGGRDGGKGQTLVILAAVSEGEAHAKAVKAVIGEVKTRYGHHSVLWEQDQVCATF